MKKYKLKSISRLSPSSFELVMEPVDIKNGLDFYPGQYISLSVRNGSKKSTFRCFSISSAPSNDGEIRVGVRSGSRYTKLLEQAELNSLVEIDGPFGEFTPDLEEKRPLILIAGGIGVTPMISILESLQVYKLNRPTQLFYFNKSSDDIPYLEKIKGFNKSRIFVSGSFKEDNSLEVGELCQESLSEALPEKLGSSADYYICGPAGFMKKATDILRNSGVPEANIITESFSSTSKNQSVFSSLSFATYILAGFLIAGSITAFAAKDFVKNLLKENDSRESENEVIDNTNNYYTDESSTNTHQQPSGSQSTQRSSTYQSPRSTAS